MRLFIGLVPGTDALLSWQRFQKTANPGWPLRWIQEASLHLTLKFLGDVEYDKLLPINEILAEIASRTYPFHLELESGGTFPAKGKPVAFWVGIKGDSQKLEVLAEQTQAELKSLGFPKEDRDFLAHMTVAKVRSDEKIGPDLKKDYQSWISGFKTPSFEIGQFCLYESILGPTGANYQIRGCFPLAFK